MIPQIFHQSNFFGESQFFQEYLRIHRMKLKLMIWSGNKYVNHEF
jgi:hypothetical protein